MANNIIEAHFNEGSYGRMDQYNSWSGGKELWATYAPDLGTIFRGLMGFAEADHNIIDFPDGEKSDATDASMSLPLLGMLETVQANAEPLAHNIEQEALMAAFRNMFGTPQLETIHLGSAQVFVHLRELAQQAENWVDDSAERFHQLVAQLRDMVLGQFLVLEQERLAKQAELEQAMKARDEIAGMHVTKAQYVAETNEVVGTVNQKERQLQTELAVIGKKQARFEGFLQQLQTIELVNLDSARGRVAAAA